MIVRASIRLSTRQTSTRSRCEQNLSFNTTLPIGIGHATDLPTYFTPYLELKDSGGLFFRKLTSSLFRSSFIFGFEIPSSKSPSLCNLLFQSFLRPLLTNLHWMTNVSTESIIFSEISEQFRQTLTLEFLNIVNLNYDYSLLGRSSKF